MLSHVGFTKQGLVQVAPTLTAGMQIPPTPGMTLHVGVEKHSLYCTLGQVLTSSQLPDVALHKFCKHCAACSGVVTHDVLFCTQMLLLHIPGRAHLSFTRMLQEPPGDEVGADVVVVEVVVGVVVDDVEVLEDVDVDVDVEVLAEDELLVVHVRYGSNACERAKHCVKKIKMCRYGVWVNKTVQGQFAR